MTTISSPRKQARAALGLLLVLSLHGALFTLPSEAAQMNAAILSDTSTTTPIQPLGLSGCGANRIYPYNQGGQSYFRGGHSYCGSGQTSGIQRVKVYCSKKTDPSSIKVVYGDLTVAKQWSAKECPTGYAADQAQTELS